MESDLSEHHIRVIRGAAVSLILADNGPPLAIRTAGSGVVVELGGQAQVITAGHVVLGMIEAAKKSEHPRLCIHVDTPYYPVGSRRTQYSQQHDVGSFLLNAELPPTIRASTYEPTAPPPKDAFEAGATIYAVGFPGKLRRYEPPYIRPPAVLVRGNVAWVAGGQLFATTEATSWLDHPSGQPPANYAGLSGGPVFATVNGEPKLIGVLSKANDDLRGMRVTLLWADGNPLFLPTGEMVPPTPA